MSKQKNETPPRGKTLFSTAISHLLPGEKHIPRERRVFVNRNLRMEGVRALGFDMDHTLALYHRAPFEQLTHDLALQNLVEWRGYPESIRSIHYNPDCIIRGLIVDKRHGNILKMDFHGYIAKAMHGSHVLDRDERKKLYRRSRVNLRSDRYQSFDTLFSMPEGSLYSALMDLRSMKPESEFSHLKPNQIFDDVRASVDKAHRDGSLKSIIVKDLSRYFVWDPDLAATLLRFRALGKKVFLLTNSEHSYTEAVMNYLLGQAEGNWKQLFDLVVVSAGKPGFFLEKSQPEGIPTPECPGREEFCFSGGNASWAERFLGANGDQVLYFGDHTYGDILKSKKKVGWRTAMIVQELEQEVAANRRLLYQRRELNGLMARQQDLALDRDHLRFLLETLDGNGEGGALSPGERHFSYRLPEMATWFGMDEKERNRHREGMQRVLEGLDYMSAQYGERMAELSRVIMEGHNPYWGSLFREGNENSRFGRQVREFACIYTSRVSNFLAYSGNTYFIAPEERMPHER
jgi:HAD superfamily 5'-nucleotidase-like hydrolase